MCLQFFTQDGTKISVRPSGTEPKIKFYFEVKGKHKIERAQFDELENLNQKIKLRLLWNELGLYNSIRIYPFN